MSSIFRKQFFMFTGILMLSFLLLAAGLTQAFSSFFINQRREILINQGEKISQILEQSYYFGRAYNKEYLDNAVSILGEYLESSFIYVTKNNEIVMISKGIDTNWLGEKIDGELIDSILEGNIVSSKKYMYEIFNEPVFTVGYPVSIEGEVIGGIFMNFPLSELNYTMGEAYRIILVFMCVAILTGFVLIYISSKNTVKPILEINEAAKIIASGQFEKRINIKPNDEIGQLAESFNEMAESLMLQDKRRRDFISNISHDIRSPLTSMKGFIQAIMDGTIPEEKYNKYLGIILEESDRLAILANNIIDFYNAESGDTSLNLSGFDLNEMIRRTLLKLENRFFVKKIKPELYFEFEECYVFADKDKIQRVMYNLIDNAIKFTQNEGTIKIKTFMKYERVYVSVKDNGVGMNEETQKRVFERFYKEDISRNMDKKGSGLGLSIVKEFLKAHGSIIDVKSEEGKGSEFIFYLQAYSNLSNK